MTYPIRVTLAVVAVLTAICLVTGCDEDRSATVPLVVLPPVFHGYAGMECVHQDIDGIPCIICVGMGSRARLSCNWSRAPDGGK